MFIPTWRRSEPVNPSSLAVFYWDVRRSEVLTGWQRRPCSGCAALAQGRGAGTYRRATRSPMQRWSHRWNSWGWCCPGAGKTPGNPKDVGGISVNPYLCIPMNCIKDAINCLIQPITVPSGCPQTVGCWASSCAGTCPGPRAGPCHMTWWWRSGRNRGQK